MPNIESIPAAPSLIDTPFVKRLLQSECKIDGKIDEDGESLYLDVMFNGDTRKKNLVINATTTELERLQSVVDDLLESRYKQEEKDNAEFEEEVARFYRQPLMEQNPHSW